MTSTISVIKIFVFHVYELQTHTHTHTHTHTCTHTHTHIHMHTHTHINTHTYLPTSVQLQPKWPSSTGMQWPPLWQRPYPQGVPSQSPMFKPSIAPNLKNHILDCYYAVMQEPKLINACKVTTLSQHLVYLFHLEQTSLHWQSTRVHILQTWLVHFPLQMVPQLIDLADHLITSN